MGTTVSCSQSQTQGLMNRYKNLIGRDMNDEAARPRPVDKVAATATATAAAADEDYSGPVQPR